MIQRVDGPKAGQRYRRAIEGGAGPVECMLGSRLEAFETLSGSGWSFYTGGRGEEPFALAVRGCSAWMAGKAEPQQLALLLKVMGVRRITSNSGEFLPEGWQPCEQLAIFRMQPGKEPAAENLQNGFSLQKAPSLWQVSQLISQQPGFDTEAQENFYADSCVLQNRGFARIWAAEGREGLAATAGAYGLYKGLALLSAVYTCPEQRKQHLGRSLTAQLAAGLCADGYVVTLECAPGREAFYSAMGFEPAGFVQKLSAPNDVFSE